MEPDMVKIIQVLISLLEEQEGVTIEYELEKIASWGDNQSDKPYKAFLEESLVGIREAVR